MAKYDIEFKGNLPNSVADPWRFVAHALTPDDALLEINRRIEIAQESEFADERMGVAENWRYRECSG